MKIKLSFDELIESAPVMGFIFTPLALFADASRKEEPLTEYEAWHLLCTKVNYADRHFKQQGKWVTCKRGESIQSTMTWAQLFGWTTQEVQAYFVKLLKLGYLERPEKAISPNHIRVRCYEKLTGKQRLVQEEKSAPYKGDRPDDGAAGTPVTPQGNTPPVLPILAGNTGNAEDAEDAENEAEADRIYNEFFRAYHEITKMPRLGRGKARRIWDTMTPEKQDQAIDMIEEYYNSLPDKKYCRRAASYLEEEIG